MKSIVARIIVKLSHHPAQSFSKILGWRYWVRLFRANAQDEGIEPPTIAGFGQNEKVVLTRSETPLVSIVVPVYNQIETTLVCLKSIALNSGDVPYEVLLGDDCSTDETIHIGRIVENLRVVRHSSNLRFLLNCNETAKKARGKFLVFLNNDTHVQPDWLRPLVSLLERDASIGMAGSKLVYPDGRLQEAGGIIWSDASGWNFGRLDDPTLPQYNYVRDVDYISGAAIMIRSSLWRDLGGFDEHFAPAYYEDSDLAFRVRQAGFRVVYQPLSQVVHFEGVTNGTDLSSGQKSYQVVNLEKFKEKWQTVLESEHFPNAQEVFWARDRSSRKKTIVFVDHYIPQPDQDAGSRTLYQYICFAARQGWNVKFLGENFYYDPQYRGLLEAEGVEILAGVYYRDHWEDWLAEHGDKIDAVFLCRPHVAEQFLPAIRRRCPRAWLAYYCVDLHYIRLQREYAVTGDASALQQAKSWQKREEALISKVDSFVTISSDERDIILKAFPGKSCVVIPCFAWDGIDGLRPEPKGRSDDLLFVGGFGHPPNKDGVVWFLEKVWPGIQARNPRVKLHIVGSRVPEEVLNWPGTGVVVHGFLSDTALNDLYRRVKAVVVPLRYGSGVKGKTVEAMKNGVPIVSTPVGIEGLPGLPPSVRAVQEADEFRVAVEELLNQPQSWLQQSREQLDYVKQVFTADQAIHQLRLALNLPRENAG